MCADTQTQRHTRTLMFAALLLNPFPECVSHDDAKSTDIGNLIGIVCL